MLESTSGAIAIQLDLPWSMLYIHVTFEEHSEELELELIDYGAEEVFADEDGIIIYAPFGSFGSIQKYLEDLIAEEILKSKINEGDIIQVDYKKGGEKLVIDIVDQHDIFRRHWDKRRRWYNTQKFNIEMTSVEGYKNDEWEIVPRRKKSTKIKVNTEPYDSLLNGVCLL